MKLEQQAPNSPNFGRVVLAAGIAIIIIFLLAIFFLRVHKSRVEHPYRNQPTSQLLPPRSTESPVTPT